MCRWSYRTELLSYLPHADRFRVEMCRYIIGLEFQPNGFRFSCLAIEFRFTFVVRDASPNGLHRDLW